jgi:hypothetical protein
MQLRHTFKSELHRAHDSERPGPPARVYSRPHFQQCRIAAMVTFYRKGPDFPVLCTSASVQKVDGGILLHLFLFLLLDPKAWTFLLDSRHSADGIRIAWLGRRFAALREPESLSISALQRIDPRTLPQAARVVCPPCCGPLVSRVVTSTFDIHPQ